jgi:hypothetical protein
VSSFAVSKRLPFSKICFSRSHSLTSYIFLFFLTLSRPLFSPPQEFNTSGSSNTDTGKAAGNLETKYKMKELGLSFNQKWNTDNTLATEVTVEDQLAQGLKLALDTSFVPNTG